MWSQMQNENILWKTFYVYNSVKFNPNCLLLLSLLEYIYSPNKLQTKKNTCYRHCVNTHHAFEHIMSWKDIHVTMVDTLVQFIVYGIIYGTLHNLDVRMTWSLKCFCEERDEWSRRVLEHRPLSLIWSRELLIHIITTGILFREQRGGNRQCTSPGYGLNIFIYAQSGSSLHKL